MEGVDLTGIQNFGGIDADADALLDQCFEEHESYAEARAHRRFLILGRKGAGKTAIYRKLIRSKDPNFFSIGHTFDDYPWYYHDRQAVAGVPDEERFLHSWKYLILITLSKVLLNWDNSQPWSDEALEALAKIERFVVDSYGTRDPDVTQVFAPSKTLKLKGTFGVKLGGMGVGIDAERLPVEHLPLVVQEVNKTLLAAACTALNPDSDYYVCFDQLDLRFDPQDANYKDRLVGLLLAARDINRAANDSGKTMSCLVFLRDDIFQGLRFEDKNKLTENHMTRIEWDTERTSHTLKAVMEKRFAILLDIAEEGAWDRVFDETHEMRGRQSKYQHMIDRTFLRPRDMIKYCNEALVSHRARDDGPAQIDNKDVVAARQPYSEYLLSELEDEVFKHIRNYEPYIELLKSLDTLGFDIGNFKDVCGMRARIVPEDTDAMGILRELFEFSIIGFYQSGGQGYGGSGYVWKYMNPRAQFNEAATRFKVHPGFTEVLGLKMWSRK